MNKEPNYSHPSVQDNDWSRIVYGHVKEEIPKDIPKLLRNRVVTATFLDASLHHDILTAVFHFINTTPIDWYSKRQATVKAVTYGSEVEAVRTESEQIVDARNMLRYHGQGIHVQ